MKRNGNVAGARTKLAGCSRDILAGVPTTRREFMQGVGIAAELGNQVLAEGRHQPAHQRQQDRLRELRGQGVLARGMLAKAAAIESAIEGGVPRVHLISGSARDSLLREIFTNEGSGTLIVRSIRTLSSDEQQVGEVG